MITPVSLSNVELEAVLDQRLAAFTCSEETSSSVIFSYSFEQYYLPEQSHLQLLACVSLTRTDVGIQVFAGVIKASQITAQLSTLEAIAESLKGQRGCVNDSATMVVVAGTKAFYGGLGEGFVSTQGFRPTT